MYQIKKRSDFWYQMHKSTTAMENMMKTIRKTSNPITSSYIHPLHGRIKGIKNKTRYPRNNSFKLFKIDVYDIHRPVTEIDSSNYGFGYPWPTTYN